MDLHLYNYNNYYNRQIKSPQVALDDINEVYTEVNISFNPNDGITTEHIIGGVTSYSGTADYAILTNGDEIISCWFIIENQRTRAGQYKIILKRDTVGENLEAVLNAPCFVEKGWIADSDPAVFNKENMTFNQIKKGEILLKDETQIPWLVGYYHKGKTLQASITESATLADITVNGLENWEYYDYFNDHRLITELKAALRFNSSTLTIGKQTSITIGGLGQSELAIESQRVSDVPVTTANNYYYKLQLGAADLIPTQTSVDLLNNLTTRKSNLFLTAKQLFSGYLTQVEYDAIYGLSGSTIFDSAAGKLYRLNLEIEVGDTTSTDSVDPTLTSAFGYEIYNAYRLTDGITAPSPTSGTNANNFTVAIAKTTRIRLTRTELDYKSYSLTLNPLAEAQSSRNPYNMFALPFGEFTVGLPDSTFKTMTSDLSLRLCMEFIQKYSGASGELIDLQLLPYCPITEIRIGLESGSKPIFLLSKLESSQWTPITDSNEETVGCAFYCTESSHKFNLNYQVRVDNIKISNETEMCRLISPNWNGMFEFSPAKNYGVDYFTVDYELKPFQPYIHVAPAWNRSGLYGNRRDDAIGLICGGDFGLSLISDAWATYERQNKNYREIFDRQIQNLEVQQKYQRIQETIGAFVGTAGGVTGGAMLGSMLGNTGIGALSGGLVSAAGGIADIAINEALRTEAMDYTKDLFGYQMGNIQALPDSLTRVNSFNPNNKVFPILEFYGCTEQETAALLNKLIYNGYTVGRIGQLKDYINPTADSTYIKGQLILLEDFNEDSHFANDIANEIYKGVRV